MRKKTSLLFVLSLAALCSGCDFSEFISVSYPEENVTNVTDFIENTNTTNKHNDEQNSEKQSEQDTNQEKEENKDDTTQIISEGYYAGIDEAKDNLLDQLRSLNSQKKTKEVGYSSMGTSVSGQYKYTDYDPETVKYDSKGQPYGTRIISFYSGTSMTSWNREHVWPNSHGGNLVEDDIHMPRPTVPSENGSRGNSFYVEGKRNSSSGWDPAEEDFGDETYRGDSARIVFYCVVADSKLSLIDEDQHQTSNAHKDYLMGKLSDLLKWNLEYPVTDRELRRNSGAEYLQGNRNPFIDHPDYACKIWGNYNSTTKSICGGK